MQPGSSSRTVWSAIFALALFVCIYVTPSHAFTPETLSLWISHGERIRVSAGEAVVPVKVGFGRFPDGRRDLSELVGLRVAYAVNNNSASAWVWREIDLQSRDANGYMPIAVREGDSILIYAHAVSKDGRVSYSAKSSISRFGRKKPPRQFDVATRIPGFMELDVLPAFHYWRQTGEQLKVGIRGAGDQMNQTMLALDENMPVESILLGRDGYGQYTPPDDIRLNALSSQASKTTLLVAEKMESGIRHVASYSLLLHRNRFQHRNQMAGAVLFSATAVVVLAWVVFRRRKARF